MDRPLYSRRLADAFQNSPIAALLGPRQCGKTTLARQYAASWEQTSPPTHFDLEDPLDLARLENPKLALQNLSGLVIIDEIQRRPELFPVLRVLVDRPSNTARFLILGSASRELIRQSSESLAGRIQYLELTPFAWPEVRQERTARSETLDLLWRRGGFPRSFLADTEPLSVGWRKAYVTTYLERDIPQLGIDIPAPQLRRFWMMLAHYHGQTFNASEISKSLGVSDKTVKRYLDILTGTFMVRQLQPWLENIKKRQVKTPKIYFRDSGIFHSLLGLESAEDLQRHPKLGASWEGFALEEVARSLGAEPQELFFWGVHGEAELDLLSFKNGRRTGFEIKYAEAPRITPSMRRAFQQLRLNELRIVYPGDTSFEIEPGFSAVGLATLSAA